MDERRLRGRYLLTGSSNLLVQRDVSEGLAGRAGYITLLPLTRRERLGLGSAGLWSGLLEEKSSDWSGLLEAGRVRGEEWQALAA